MLEVRLLGRFELRRDGAAVVLPSRPAQSLLAYLVLSAGTAHRREKLAGLFWPDADEDNARSNLRHALWRIRKAIESDTLATPYLLTDELAVSFNSGSDYWLDAAMLARNNESLQDQLDALSVYQGELLPGFYEDWVTLERERLEAQFQHSMHRLLDRLAAARQWPDVIEWSERWIALGHAPEPGYRALMQAHAELGDRARVASVYARCREALFNELGVEPSASTRRLYERLRRDDAESTDGSTPAAAPTTLEDESPAPGESPFQGLRYFDEADAARFFGREQLTSRLIGRVRAEPFVAVIGASGSGKSSVVRAGLVPALRDQASDRTNEVRVLTPTAHPLDALAGSLASNGDRTTLLEELSRDPHGLERFLDSQRRQGVVIVVDQFEELFTLCRNPFERDAFTENLLGAADRNGSIRVVIALRADFYAHCADDSGLREAVAGHQEYVGPLSPVELRHAIEGPAEQGGWQLEPGLVDLLLRDVGEEPGALPLLSHALLETWHRRRGRRLTLAGYTAAGGVQGGIAQTAETVYSQRLSREQQAIARRLFLRLTELGEGTQDTRRRAAIGELMGPADDARETQAVLLALAEARLITLDENTVEVAHEALIREWPRLREWLNQDRQGLRLQRQLAQAADEWQRLDRDSGSLYRAARLSQALDWAEEHPAELGSAEAEFLAASRDAAEHEAAEREAQRQRELEAAKQLAEAEHQRADDQRRSAIQLRQRALLLGLALAVAVLMAGAAVFFGDAARRQAAIAETDARAAVSRELAAAALTNLTLDPERAALLALQAVSITYAVDRSWTSEAEDALHRVLPLLRAQLTLVGHTGKVLSAEFSPDGRQLVTAGEDGTARLWDALTGQAQLTLRGHTGPVNAAAFSPDGRLVATAGDDQTVKIWDTTSGRERASLVGHAREVERLAFSPDGTKLATSSLDGTVILWDASSGGSLSSFRPNRAGDIRVPLDVAFSPDGERVATVIPDGEIDEWDLSAEQPRLKRSWVVSESRTLARSIAFSPDGIWLAATTDTGAQVWWAESGVSALNIVGHGVQALDAVFSPDGSRIATASVDRTVKIWDALSGRELLTLAGHAGAVSRVAFSPDGRRLASSSWDGTAKIWDLSLAREVRTLPTSDAGISPSLLGLHTGGIPGAIGANLDPPRLAEGPVLGQIAVSRDGTRLIAGVWDGKASIWDARTGESVASLRVSQFQVWGAAISPDGTRIATGSADRAVRVWDATTRSVLWTGTRHTDRVQAVAFSADGALLATASADGTARLWDVATGEERTLLKDAQPLTSVVFSPDSRRLATAGDGPDGAVHVWDAGSGRLQVTLAGHQGSVWSVSFSPDGTRLVTAGRDGTARVWDAASGQSVLTLRGDGSTLVSAVFDPDGARIATGNRDGSAQVWDAASGRVLLTLTAAETSVGEGIDSLTFSPDGRTLIVRGDLAVRFFALPIDDLTTLVNSRLTRTWSVDECRRYLHVDGCPDSLSQLARTPRQAQTFAAAPAMTPGGVTSAIATPGASPLTGAIKIVSSLPRVGTYGRDTDSLVNAFKMALDDHNNRVGNAAIIYQDWDDANAATGVWDGQIEVANANRALNDPSVLVYLGTWNSPAARLSIPLLCRGNLAMISPANTYAGLTKMTPYNTPNEPEVYYPGCQRNYARVVPTDDQQGAVGAEFARQLGVRKVYVLRDSSSSLYGPLIAQVFAETAKRIGLQVVGGPEDADPSARSYHELAQRILQAEPDMVYFGGTSSEMAGRLWGDLRASLGNDVTLMSGDGLYSSAFIQAAGAAAEGTYVTFTGMPSSRLTGLGADWYQRYRQRFQAEPIGYAPFGYEVMNVALAAIERAGTKDRAAIRDALLATRDYAGILGNWSFTPTGDTTLTRMTVRQVRDGQWDEANLQVIQAPE